MGYWLLCRSLSSENILNYLIILLKNVNKSILLVHSVSFSLTALIIFEACKIFFVKDLRVWFATDPFYGPHKWKDPSTKLCVVAAVVLVEIVLFVSCSVWFIYPFYDCCMLGLFCLQAAPGPVFIKKLK